MKNRIKNVNGIEIELTDKEQEELEAEEKKWDDGHAERDLDELRFLRNNLLTQTDWTQSRDVTLSNDTEWKKYRQELRDITKTFKSITDKNFKFPDKPTE